MTAAVIFDLDGTLADTPAAIGRLLVRVCAEAGRAVTRREAVATVGAPLETAFGRLLAQPPHAPETRLAVSRYRSLFEEEVLSEGPRLAHDGVHTGLRRLHRDGVPMAVATSKVTRSAHALLEAMEISAFLPVVVGHDRVNRGKPDPESALAAAGALGVAAGESAYVGDTVTDMRMAAAAGMLPVAVTYGVDDRDALAAAAGPGGSLCTTFDEVLDAVRGRAADGGPPLGERVRS